MQDNRSDRDRRGRPRDSGSLPEIPIIDIGHDGFHALVQRHGRYLHDAIRIAKSEISGPLMLVADKMSKKWAAKTHIPYYDEIDRISNIAKTSGVWLLNLSYEWGCTAGIKPTSQVDPSPMLMRSLDWNAPGIGRLIVGARRETAAGMWLNLTWPGFVGSYQGLAPRRFAACINQAPRRARGLGYSLDWGVNRMTIWRSRNIPPVLLLRRIFDECKTFKQARALLINTPISAPTIFTLVGKNKDEALIIERMEERAIVHKGMNAVANHWITEGMSGKPYFDDSKERMEAMQDFIGEGKESMGWARSPILGFRTKLVMEAWPNSGNLKAQAFETERPVSSMLAMNVQNWKDPMENT